MLLAGRTMTSDSVLRRILAGAIWSGDNLLGARLNESPPAKALPKTALGGQFCPAHGRPRAIAAAATFFHLFTKNFGKTKPYQERQDNGGGMA